MKTLFILCSIGILLGGSGVRSANADSLLSPEGEWVAPGLKNPFVLVYSAVSEKKFFLKITDMQIPCVVTEHSDSILIFVTGNQKHETALLKISDNALLFADGWITGMLLVRRGMEGRTSPPSDGVWREGNFMRENKIEINFTEHLCKLRTEIKRFRTEPASDQSQFPGLTLLVGDDGKPFLECVRMGDDVLACRLPLYSEDGDDAFFGLIMIPDPMHSE
jgi:hypothetical protein